MAVIKVMLDDYASKDGNKIYIRVHHDGRKKRYPTGFKSHLSDWDEEMGLVRRSHPNSLLINETIKRMLSDANKYQRLCELTVKPFNINHVFNEHDVDGCFTKFIDRLILRYMEDGKIHAAVNCKPLLKQLRDYNNGREVYYDDLTKDFIRGFDLYMKKERRRQDGYLLKGNTVDSRKCKLERLSTYYGEAMREDNAPTPNPFLLYKIREKSTAVPRQWLTKEEVETLEKLELKKRLHKKVRDMYLCSIYIRGIRFQNILFLKKSDVRNGRVYYTPNKGGKPSSISIKPKLQEVLDRYQKKSGDYFFLAKNPTYDMASVAFINATRVRNTRFNAALAQVIKEAKIEKKITFHTARHTFGHMALSKTRNMTIVKELMGHADERVTKRYASGFDDAHLDEFVDDVYSD